MKPYTGLATPLRPISSAPPAYRIPPPHHGPKPLISERGDVRNIMMNLLLHRLLMLI